MHVALWSKVTIFLVIKSQERTHLLSSKCMHNSIRGKWVIIQVTNGILSSALIGQYVLNTCRTKNKGTLLSCLFLQELGVALQEEWQQIPRAELRHFLPHRIRISENLPWDRKAYLTHAILPRTSSNIIMWNCILAYSGTSWSLF